MLKNIRKDLIVNLIGSILFVSFLNPIFEFSWKFLKKFYAGYIDSLYENASLGQRNWIDFIMYVVVVFVGYNVLIAYFFRYITTYNDLDKSDLEDEKIEKMNEEERELYVNNQLLKSENKLRRIRQILNISFKVNYITLPLGYLVLISSLFKGFTDLQLNTSFNRRLNALAPYITEEDEEKLKSKWALMESRNDFLVINNLMESEAKKFNLKLPQNLLE